ncbi:MAG: hypothetical protein KA807_06455 [Prolixibacteraceae bacterium]|nr:hypothetical protein [Prolixibacteraceae bacterium]
MARPIESQLYRELVDSCFNFIERGTREINEIYDSVQHRFPTLCDNEYPCLHYINRGIHQAEWKHRVRNALQRCKRIGDNVNFSGRRGYWTFS